jgi:UDP-glucose 4-epimerase
VRDGDALRGLLAGEHDCVFHLAALHFIPYCEQHEQETLDVNVGGTRALLDALRGRQDVDVVLASSAAVYGFSDETLTERAPVRPTNVYGRSKVLAEQLLAEHCQTHQSVHGTALRLFNVYGPGETNPHVVPELVSATAAVQARVELGNLWPRRDYVHVEDVVGAMIAVAARARSARAERTCAGGGFSAVNVATGIGTTVRDLVDQVSAVRRRPVETVVTPQRLRTDDGHLVGSSSALRRATGWAPSRALQDGLEELLTRA